MEKRYQIYIIKSTKDGNMFAGLTSTDNSNMLRWIYNKSKTGTAYTKLAKSIKENGYSTHSFQRTNNIFNNKDEGEEFLKKLQTSLEEEGKLLNDTVINTDKYVCPGCKKNIRVMYKDVHDEKYCTSVTNDYIQSLIRK